MLIKDYYSIENSSSDGATTRFQIRLHRACTVYQGHFPEKAVSPGVCNIQMLKELAEQAAGKPLRMGNLQQCRLTTLITPDEYPTLTASIRLEEKEGRYTLRASLGQGEETFLDMKAELEEKL